VPYHTGQSVPLLAGWNLVAAPFPTAGLGSDVVATQIDGIEPGGGTVTAVAAEVNGAMQVYVPGTGAPFRVPSTSAMWNSESVVANVAPKLGAGSAAVPSEPPSSENAPVATAAIANR